MKAQLHASCLGSLQRRLGALRNQSGLELRNVRHRDEHELTHRAVEPGQIAKQHLNAGVDKLQLRLPHVRSAAK